MHYYRRAWEKRRKVGQFVLSYTNASKLVSESGPEHHGIVVRHRVNRSIDGRGKNNKKRSTVKEYEILIMLMFEHMHLSAVFVVSA